MFSLLILLSQPTLLSLLPILSLSFVNFISFTNLRFRSSFLYMFSLSDSFSLFIAYITFIVFFVSLYFIINLKPSFGLYFSVYSIIVICCFIFSSSNIFLIYFFYEVSLFPILFIIVRFGSYPDRSLRAFMLLSYTAFFSFPFLFVLFYFYCLDLRFNLPELILTQSSFWQGSSLLTFAIFLAFAVKLPMYGLHFWLPMAHVEAPTFGSIILAGVLLKLGGVGLIRLSFLMDLRLLRSFLLAYFMMATLLVTFICCFQSDFKRLVAYSSVSHIIAIPLLIASRTFFSIKTIVLIMFFHGLRSPVLFMFVGVLYSVYSTRQLVAMRGLLLVSPLLRLFLVLGFLFTLSAPPFPSFLSEVFFFLSIYSLTPLRVFLMLVFAFISLVYNLNWLTSILFVAPSKFQVNSFVSFSFRIFLPLILSFLLCVSLLILLPFF